MNLETESKSAESLKSVLESVKHFNMISVTNLITIVDRLESLTLEQKRQIITDLTSAVANHIASASALLVDKSDDDEESPRKRRRQGGIERRHGGAFEQEEEDGRGEK